jgi:PAS domain S-box-containing protein
VFVRSFKDKKPLLINEISRLEKDFSPKSKQLIKDVGAEGLICVPILYKEESLGILVVDNIETKRPLTQSDVNLLLGVASQIATGISNAISFQKIQESETKYRELVENANSIILRMKTSGEITFFNEFAQKLFGYEEKDILGKNIESTLLPVNGEEPLYLDRIVETLTYDPEQQVVSEEQHLLSNGRKAWVAWTYKLIRENENFEEILCIGNDVTELKAAAEEKKSLETQLQQAQRMEAIGTLAGGIAHDFNNILQALFGYTQIMLMTRKEDDSDYGHLQSIERSLYRASDLTRRLLIFSRKIQSELRLVNLNMEVLEVSKMLERTIPKMIHIELRLDADLKNINADTGQLEQIMMNLAVNARDAMPEGGVLAFQTQNVTMDKEFCSTHIGAVPGEYVLLSVSDTGSGMDKDTMERVFEPFFTTKETGKGTGLGLAMVYGIVKNHGGYITCESVVGSGTTFDVYLPAIKDELQENVPERRKAVLSGGNETILLVDDENDIRKIAQEMLERVGYRVVTAEDGETALSIYGKNLKEIDLVILDLIMPGMGGKKCLEELLKINIKARVIVASGQSINGYTKETIDRLAKGFVSKPYKIEEMLKMIRSAIKNDYGRSSHNRRGADSC